MLTTIPFSGFYNSMHDSEIDRALESMVSDSSGCHAISDRIANDIWSYVNTPVAEYTREFVADFQILFNEETGLNVTFDFDAVDSPKYYNFTTDRIFAVVSESDVQAMFAKVDKAVLARVIRDRFTSYDGFISHYTNSLTDWQTEPLNEWDHNQVGTIVEALVSQFLSPEWEWNVIEDWSGNGLVDRWVYDGLDAEGKRLVKIADYLRQREERQYR